jgi:ParB-like chromosome segregation protein Spo0J
MNIQKIPRKQINPAPYNPRRDLKPGDPEYDALYRSVKEFGLVQLLAWNKRTGTLVGGHQTLKVLDDLGRTEIDVAVVDMDPIRERALNIALNKIQGDWDQDKLRDLLLEIDQSDEVDLELTGFSQQDLQALLGEIDESPGPTPLEILPNVSMVWVFAGIPLEQYSEASIHIESLSQIPGVFLEQTAR